MKHINESIIGRRGTNSTKLWLLYLVNVDYQDANHIIPKQCRIYYDGVVLFCIDHQQLKEYFFHNLGFKQQKSMLFEVNPRYLRTFEEVKEWARQSEISNRRLAKQQDLIENLRTAKELNEIITTNIPKYIKSL